MPEKQTITARCEYCGDSFTAKRASAKFCTPSHRTLATLERKAKKDAAAGADDKTILRAALDDMSNAEVNLYEACERARNTREVVARLKDAFEITEPSQP